MPEIQAAWPRKTRELHNHHMNSTVWNDFAFRDDDVIVATYAKSGTTWTQQIVGQLIHGGREDIAMHELSPWLDLRIMPPEAIAAVAAQPHRRVMKTHLPVDALVFSPRAKYLYIGRDGRDVLWSLHNHHAHGNELFFGALNDTPGRVGPPLPPADPDIRSYFNTWLAQDGYPFWSFWDSITSWWAIRDLPNVKLVHFDALKADLAGEMKSIADFLEVDIPAAQWPDVVAHCTFDYMKANAEKVAPLGGALFEGGASTFINKGTNGRWRDVLSAQESAAYEAMALEKLGPDCARWLATGA
ncbi:sulfotransferase domain-containing protein [Phenylobacterium sp.]|uniref:sulfotransferase domain-containing protein n=1 Tax=Phenylobacterium sp. TaxID=1871053 RepID=UPI0030F3DAC8